MPPEEPAWTDSLIEVLDLEEIDTDLYRGRNETASLDWPALFGGQVAAQALRAAANTVPEGRLPNSLHGYFLRPGHAERHVILRVARDRDGRSFSARHVVAIQNGEVIFSMSASFHTVKDGDDYDMERTPPAAGPDDLDDSPWIARFGTTLQLKPFPPTVAPVEDQWPVPARAWVRTMERLPDDPYIHACALAYISDLGSGFGDGTAPGVPRGGPSIDHAMWFHDDIRADEWLYLDMWPVKAGGSRGLYSGSIHSLDGRLGATLSQEMLFHSPGAPRPRLPIPRLRE